MSATTPPGHRPAIVVVSTMAGMKKMNAGESQFAAQ
jgi:hypothetical protein